MRTFQAVMTSPISASERPSSGPEPGVSMTTSCAPMPSRAIVKAIRMAQRIALHAQRGRAVRHHAQLPLVPARLAVERVRRQRLVARGEGAEPRLRRRRGGAGPGKEAAAGGRWRRPSRSPAAGRGAFRIYPCGGAANFSSEPVRGFFRGRADEDNLICRVRAAVPRKGRTGLASSHPARHNAACVAASDRQTVFQTRASPFSNTR